MTNEEAVQLPNNRTTEAQWGPYKKASPGVQPLDSANAKAPEVRPAAAAATTTAKTTAMSRRVEEGAARAKPTPTPTPTPGSKANMNVNVNVNVNVKAKSELKRAGSGKKEAGTGSLEEQMAELQADEGRKLAAKAKRAAR